MKRMINNILLIICIFIFCISTWKLYGYYRSYKKAKDTYSKIAKENVKISKNERKIDFKKLKSQNQDIAGWIYIRGTTIDYPIVQGKDNEEYLHQDFNKKKSSSGTIFLDNNCKKDFTSDFNFIFGYHLMNGTMFAQLLKFREKSFLKKHNEIMIFTPDRTIHLKVISAYAQKAQNKIPVTFANDEQKKAYIKKIESMSEQTIKTSRINDSHIYTFVTCSYEGEDNRTYVHAAEE